MADVLINNLNSIVYTQGKYGSRVWKNSILGQQGNNQLGTCGMWLFRPNMMVFSMESIYFAAVYIDLMIADPFYGKDMNAMLIATFGSAAACARSLQNFVTANYTHDCIFTKQSCPWWVFSGLSLSISIIDQPTLLMSDISAPDCPLHTSSTQEAVI